MADSNEGTSPRPLRLFDPKANPENDDNMVKLGMTDSENNTDDTPTSPPAVSKIDKPDTHTYFSPSQVWDGLPLPPENKGHVEDSPLLMVILDSIDNGTPCSSVITHFTDLVMIARTNPAAINRLIESAGSRHADSDYERENLDTTIRELRNALDTAEGATFGNVPDKGRTFNEGFGPHGGAAPIIGFNALQRPSLYIPEEDSEEHPAKTKVYTSKKVLSDIAQAIKSGTRYSDVFAAKNVLIDSAKNDPSQIIELMRLAEEPKKGETPQQADHRETMAIALRTILELAGHPQEPVASRREFAEVGTSQQPGRFSTVKKLLALVAFLGVTVIVGETIHAVSRNDRDATPPEKKAIDALDDPEAMRKLVRELGQDGVRELTTALESDNEEVRKTARDKLTEALKKIPVRKQVEHTP